MTQTVETARKEHTGDNSTTSFAFDFPITAAGDISVYEDEVLQTITTHYTVSVSSYPGTGNIVFGTAPGTGDAILFTQNVPETQSTSFTAFNALPAVNIGNALDRASMHSVRRDDKIETLFGVSDTMKTTDRPTMTISDVAADRASKLLGFNDAGTALAVIQEIGSYTGNWAASTAYVVRDLIKDTSNNNIYICVAAHTSSGAQPISSNADVAKWALIVDAASATTSASAAATSATAAATSATAAATSATAGATSATASATSATASASSATGAASSASSASTSAAAAATSYDNFDDRFLGAKSSDPTTDNDGDTPIITGALYFNSSNNVMMAYTGSAWIRIMPTSSDQTNINTLAASAVITDMDLLATSANVAAMALLGTSDAIADMNVLGTADVVTDLNTLGTADVVADMNVLGTADVVTDMNTLATSANVTAMGILATSANVTAMGLLGNAATVTDLGILGTADVVTDMNVLATSDVVTDMNTLATADIVSDMNTLGTSANVTAMATCATNIADVNNFVDQYTIASSAPGSPSEGDLWYDSSNNILKVHNGTSFVAVTSATAGITDVVDDSTPQLGGDLDLNGNNIDFPTTANISDCIDDDTFGTASATKLATSESIKAYVDAIEASEITTAGVTFSNYNAISGNTTTTTATTKNMFLMGLISVTGTAVWTIAGDGELTIT
jgi:hypothetical protein